MRLYFLYQRKLTTVEGATYLLLEHPQVLQKVVDEVRSTFASSEDITLFSVNKLQYMNAVIEESMRIYTPVANQTTRINTEGPATIDAHVIPQGVSCFVRSSGRPSLTGTDLTQSKPGGYEPHGVQLLPTRQLYPGEMVAVCIIQIRA